MKPAPFAYSAPASVAEVIGLLDIFEDEAKVIAGGQSLAAMLNMRLARPANLVDLRKLGSELSYIVDEGSQVRIGALTRHAQVERFAFVGAPSLLSKAAPYIGHPSIRSRGTIGGSVAHADPAAEFPAALTALGARFVLRSVDGTREVTPEEFFLSFYMTSIEATELLTEIVVPTWGPTTGTSFVEFARRCGDFAVTGTAVAAELAPDGAIAHLGIGICGAAEVPVNVTGAASGLIGTTPSATDVRDAAHAVSDATEPADDAQASAAYRRALVAVTTEQALHQALDEAARKNELS